MISEETEKKTHDLFKAKVLVQAGRILGLSPFSDGVLSHTQEQLIWILEDYKVMSDRLGNIGGESTPDGTSNTSFENPDFDKELEEVMKGG
jgi:hypothetical protein